MSEAKHTPGPWEAQTIAYEGAERGQAFIVGANLGGLIGAALPWPTEYDSGDFSRVRANAHLIAAAPDLVEALKSLLPALLPDAMAKDKGGLTPESRTRCMAIVKAALSKAGV